MGKHTGNNQNKGTKGSVSVSGKSNNSKSNKSKKRTNSQTSPDLVSVLPIEKRLNMDMADQYSPSFTQQSSQIPNSQIPYPPVQQLPSYNAHMNSMFNTPQQYQQSPAQTLTQVSPQSNQNFNQMVIERLDNMNKRLLKLDLIDEKVTNIDKKVSLLDARLTSL